MTNVEGVVDEVVVRGGDALGVARCARGELDTHKGWQNIFKPCRDALLENVGNSKKNGGDLQNLDVAGVVHPDLVGEVGHHPGRARPSAAHHILEPLH